MILRHSGEAPVVYARLGLVLSTVDEAAPRRALEIGCGRGRLLRALRALRPGHCLAGLDLSARMLASLPEGVTRVHGSMLDLPYRRVTGISPSVSKRLSTR